MAKFVLVLCVIRQQNTDNPYVGKNGSPFEYRAMIRVLSEIEKLIYLFVNWPVDTQLLSYSMHGSDAEQRK